MMMMMMMMIIIIIIIIIVQFNSILYFNVLTQQLQQPVTESAQTINVQKYAYA
jgi:uncharacterized membrane protein